MLDASLLVDAVVTMLRTNTDLVALLSIVEAEPIFAEYADDNRSTNFEQHIQEQHDGTLMVAWRGTRTGTFQRQEAVAHDLAIYIAPIGKVTTIFAAMLNGLCTNYAGDIRKFRLQTVHPKVNPVGSINLIPQPFLINQGLAIYDMMPATFTLMEKGVDV